MIFNAGSIATEPTRGNHDGIDTAFTGDLSSIQVATKFNIDGNSLGQPATGYLYTPEAYPHYTYLHNSSGHNESTAINEGRTAAVAYRAKVFQAGQGDSVCFNGSMYITGTKAGSTHFLANPAGSLFNGDQGAGADGVYLNSYETYLTDNGFDAAAIGAVYNFNRSNAIGAKSTFWGGARYQSVGPAYCDSVISASGKFKVGLDFAISGLDLGVDKAAISMKGGQRIYFNATDGASGNLEAGWRTTHTGETWVDYDAASSRLRVIVNNAAVATFHASDGANFQNGLNLAAGKTIRVNGNQVMQERVTGFAAMSGVTNKGSAYSTSSVTLQQLAERVNALQTALTTHGLIGA